MDKFPYLLYDTSWKLSNIPPAWAAALRRGAGGSFLCRSKPGSYSIALSFRGGRRISRVSSPALSYTPKTTYTNYEQGKWEPPFSLIIRLAVMYNVSIDYLAGLTNTPATLTILREFVEQIGVSETYTTGEQ